MIESTFYCLADEKIRPEVARLGSFCDVLDKDATLKKEKIVEYKKAKYRWAGVTFVHSTLYNGFRVISSNKQHLILDESLQKHHDCMALYDSAPEEEKIDYKLYYGLTAMVDEKIADIKEKLPLANDWERVELEERLGGLAFGKECLDEAWAKRKETNHDTSIH